MTVQQDAYRRRYRLRAPREFRQTADADTDRGRAEQVAGRLGRQLAYVPGRGWLICASGGVWEADPGAHKVRSLIYDVTEAESEGAIRRAEYLLRDVCLVVPEDFTEHTDVLHLAGGQVLVLSTGETRVCEPEDYCQWSTGVYWRPQADSRAWTQFTEWVLPQPEVREWVRRWFGYCLAPRAAEEKVVLLHGPGGDGKSTLLEAVAGVMGKYAEGGVDPGLVLRGGRVDHPTEVASLTGKRLAWINELADDAQLDEAKLRRLVSTGFVRARFIARDYVEVPISWKFVISTNTLPDVVGVVEGTWRRLIPLQLRSLRERREPIWDPADPDERDLKALLAGEDARSAILAWLVRGYRDWLDHPLAEIPAELELAGASYREEEDRVRAFIEQYVEVDPESVLLSRDLEEAIRGYRGRGVTSKTVRAWLEGRGYPVTRHADGTRTGPRGWRGLRLRIGARSSY